LLAEENIIRMEALECTDILLKKYESLGKHQNFMFLFDNFTNLVPKMKEVLGVMRNENIIDYDFTFLREFSQILSYMGTTHLRFVSQKKCVIPDSYTHFLTVMLEFVSSNKFDLVSSVLSFWKKLFSFSDFNQQPLSKEISTKLLSVALRNYSYYSNKNDNFYTKWANIIEIIRLFFIYYIYFIYLFIFYFNSFLFQFCSS
jgi:hypothetical protein